MIRPAKKLAALALKFVPVSVLRILFKVDLVVPFYHLVSDDRVPHVAHLYAHRNTTEFRSDLDFFLRNYVIVSLTEVLEALDNDRTLPDNALLLTFDDGLRETCDVVAPVLKAKGVPAVVFLCSAFLDNKRLFYRHKASLLVERLISLRSLDEPSSRKLRQILSTVSSDTQTLPRRILACRYSEELLLERSAEVLGLDFDEYLSRSKPYLTSEQVERLMQDGFAVGAHSVDHPMYSDLSLQDQLRQTRQSLDFVQDRFEMGYRAFAFPFDDRGVSRGYFEELASGGDVDVSFGTSDFRKDSWERNLQRFWMESTDLSARTIVALEYAKALGRSIFGRNRIDRR